MDRRDDELQLAIYRPPPSFTGGCLEIRLFYVRITPCAVDNPPDQLKLRHLRRELGVLLEINGKRIPSSDSVSINLRCDRVDKDLLEVTYVSTDSVRISGPAEFEVCEEGDGRDLILCGRWRELMLPPRGVMRIRRRMIRKLGGVWSAIWRPRLQTGSRPFSSLQKGLVLRPLRYI
ncbi:hypothetical protein OROGR_013447 [Orobanche gracilis]